MDYINKILVGRDLEILPKLPAEAFNCCITSPPYWSLRDYGVDPVIWDGGLEYYYKNCKHEWGNKKTQREQCGWQRADWAGKSKSAKKYNCDEEVSQGQFCLKCGAWKGSLGLEPTPELYVKHLCDIFDQVKRVLREDGTCFVNIGDSYGGSGNASGHKEYTKNLGYKTLKMGATQGNQKTTRQYAKCLLDIPYHFSIEMVKRGWIKRNTIIWHKPNCMPASAKDRFTVDFEYIFFFSKSNKALFWVNENTLECVGKKPSGTKGIESKDWEWRKCPACKGMDLIINKLKDQVCPRCKGSGKVKYSFWTGHDYCFEQQFEEYAPDTLPRMDRGANVNKWTKGPDGQTPHNLSQPRLSKKRGHKAKQNDPREMYPNNHGKDVNYTEEGRNRRCVWSIPTKSFKAAHFATFPITLIEPIISAGCPRYICKKCGKARVRLDKGYTDCSCNAGFRRGITFDPFMGAGTTAVVAKKLGRAYTGVEIKQEYANMADKRIKIIPETLF